MAGGKHKKPAVGPSAPSDAGGAPPAERPADRPGRSALAGGALAALAAAVLVAGALVGSTDEAEPEGLQDGAGCLPLGANGPTWITRGDRRVRLSALPPAARPFVCYDGRASAALGGGGSGPGMADSAVVLVEDFLSAEEVRHFRAAVRRHAQPTEQPGFLFAFAAGRQYERTEAEGRLVPFHGDEVVSRLEERIAGFLGVPASGDETHLQLSMDVAQEGANISHPNFHHDKNHGLVRYATALIYLTTPEEGGETIFPALPFKLGAPAARTPQLEAIAQEFQRITARQILENPELRKGWPAVQVDEGTALHRELSALCPAEAARAAGASAGAAEGENSSVRSLAVRPVTGRAIFFWHEVVGGSDPLLDVFHGGCPVRRGEKLSLQKFKNFAPGTIGCEVSKWCKNYF